MSTSERRTMYTCTEIPKAKSLKFQFARKIHGQSKRATARFTGYRIIRRRKTSFPSAGAHRTSRKSITRLSQPRGNIWSGSAAGIGSRRFRYRNSRHVNPITKDSFQVRWESETISQRWYRDERKQTEKQEREREREREPGVYPRHYRYRCSVSVALPRCGGSLPMDRHKTRLLHPCRLFGLDIGDEGPSTPGRLYSIGTLSLSLSFSSSFSLSTRGSVDVREWWKMRATAPGVRCREMEAARGLSDIIYRMKRNN